MELVKHLQRFFQQRSEVQRTREHREAAVRTARPLFFRPVPIKFDAVAVPVTQVEGFADSVVGCAIERDASLLQPAQGVGQRRARGVKDGEMIKACGSRWGWRTAPAFPGVKADV